MKYTKKTPFVVQAEDSLDDEDREQLGLVLQGTRCHAEAQGDYTWHLWPAPGQTAESFDGEVAYVQGFNRPRGWLITTPGTRIRVTPDDGPPYEATVVEERGDEIVVDHKQRYVTIDRSQANLP